MHHAESIPDDLRRQFATGISERLGPTGRFPDGQLDPSDRGEIQFAIAGDDERALVHLNFGTPVAYVSMTPRQAVELAQDLIRQARQVAREPVVVQLY